MVISISKFSTVSSFGGDASIPGLTEITTAIDTEGRKNYEELWVKSSGSLAATAGRALYVLVAGDLTVDGALHADGRGGGSTAGGNGGDAKQNGTPGDPGVSPSAIPTPISGLGFVERINAGAGGGGGIHLLYQGTGTNIDASHIQVNGGSAGTFNCRLLVAGLRKAA